MNLMIYIQKIEIKYFKISNQPQYSLRLVKIIRELKALRVKKVLVVKMNLI